MIAMIRQPSCLMVRWSGGSVPEVVEIVELDADYEGIIRAAVLI